MKVVFARKDKWVVGISVAVVIVGLIIAGLAFTPWMNPAQCGEIGAGSNCIIGANIGAGLVFLLGMSIAILGVVAFVASIIFRLVMAKSKRPKTVLLSLVLVIFATLVLFIYIAGEPGRKEAKHLADITSGLKNQQANFVAYKDAPKFSTISVQSPSIITQPDYIKLDLYSCIPGAGKVSYASGTTYFAISGVRHDEIGGDNDYQCVFYMDAVQTGQDWDGSLPVQCVWPIKPVMNEYTESNQRGMTVTNAGVDFRDFPLLYCQDTATGAAPKNPAFNNY